MTESSDTQREPYIFLRLFAIGLAVLVLLFSTSGAVVQASDTLQQATPGSGGQVQLPTATITPIGGATQTPTRTPTIVPVQARTIGDPTNLRTGPGIDFDIVAELEQDTRLPIIGRWLGFDWLQVLWEDEPAWVYLPLVIVEGDITTIPAVEPPPAPTPNPTQIAAELTATILVQTPGAVESATAASFGLPTGVFTEMPGAAGEEVSGVPYPTYTPPGPQDNNGNVPLPNSTTTLNQTAAGPIPPAATMIILLGIGLLMLLLGLFRRLI